ncbi:class I SAM-dependent methyltransferase [Gracilibacillus phocaeensis]|uniref:class I SAM-dependent methyltransferase n=1 Tax=Gracilibacillus phocaeensis TaxID=2042304 RepID=UPI00102F914F|nr:class I SAM-dependent methyltransferase [Gracilibacillus phocaeensis]
MAVHMKMNNTHKFNGKAMTYSKYRPSYPDQLILDMITEHHLKKDSRIADIGSGTGNFAKKMLDVNLHVLAVEPNKEMRHIAEQQLQNKNLFTSIDGTAEQTTLSASSVDLITVAQAFHWFHTTAFRKECHRILKPSGKVLLISNSRVLEAPIIQDTITIYTKYCPDFRGFSNGIEESSDIYQDFFNNGKYQLHTYSFPLTYDKTSFIGRHLSASYALNKANKDFPFFVEAFSELFERYQQSGIITLPNQTVTRCGSVF